MGITRKDLFTEQQNQFAETAKLLAHPARIAIIQHLIAVNSCINSDLVNELGLAQATISQHLKELKTGGIIQGTVEGTSMNYCINSTKWNEIKRLFNDFFKQEIQISCSTDGDCC